MSGILLSLVSMAAQADQDEVARRTMADACRMCHAIDTITLRRASSGEWREIVQRMISYGAQVPDANLIVDYLARNHGPE